MDAKLCPKQSNGTYASNGTSDSVLKEIPPFDLNSLHKNAEGSEPIASEHRYSWPSLYSWSDSSGMDDDAQNNPSPTGYNPSVHHSVQILRKANSYEAPLSPMAYGGFLSQRSAYLDETIPPSPPTNHREVCPPSKRDTLMSETAAMKDLKKKINSQKKKLRNFENEFEQEHGYKPSLEQKMNSTYARSLVIELNKNRKDLKELKEDSRLELKVGESKELRMFHDEANLPKIKQGISVDADDMLDHLSRKRDQGEVSKEGVIREMEMKMRERREVFGRPDEVEAMTADEMLAEKHDLQKMLLKYEDVYGRPESREEREIMRPFYDRYRLLKRGALRLSSKTIKKDSIELQPILEHVQMNFSSPATSRRNSLSSTKKPTPAKEEAKEVEDNITGNLYLDNLHELPRHELMKQLEEVSSEKRHLRRIVKNFEDEFQSRTGRKAEKEDKIDLESVYNNYKNVKAKLRLLEALVAKSEKLIK